MKKDKKISFDISTYCNHNCTFCSTQDSRSLKDKVSTSNFEIVMDNVLRYVNTVELGLSAKGEVFLNNDLPNIIKLAKKKYNIPYVYISTNGVLSTKEKLINILESGIDSIKFSINGLNKDTYLDVHKKDDFLLVIQNLKELIYLKKTRFPNCKILISSVTEIDQKELEIKFNDLLGYDNYIFIEAIIKYDITYTPSFGQVYSSNKIIRKCLIPFDEIYINSDCTLGLCCVDYFDEINFGNLLIKDFKDLYNNRKFHNIREMHKTNLYPDNHICKNCLSYE